MACSFRPLKAWELQDGIVFRPGTDNVLNDTTKLQRSILEVCKPIIEEGPGNTVDFVHFSAKEYVFIPLGFDNILTRQGIYCTLIVDHFYGKHKLTTMLPFLVWPTCLLAPASFIHQFRKIS